MADLATIIEPLTLPDRVAARYFAQFHIAALAIFCPLLGMPCQPVATNDLAEALAAARKAWPRDLAGPILAQAWWVSGLRSGQQVLSLVLACDLRGHPLDHGRLGVPVAKLSEVITAAAARLQIGLTDYQVGLDRAGQATGALASHLAEAQASGALKIFNQEYARRRRAAQARGLPFPAYSEARRRLIGALGQAAHQGGELDPAILRDIFDVSS